MNTNLMTKAYVNLREARHKLKREFEEQDQKLKAKMERLEAEMLKFLQENNTDSVKTQSGTFYRQEEVTPTGSDWDAFYQWVAKNDAFDALERRIKKTFIKEYMEMHDGAIPPGVSVYREYVARVRRS
jgi:adenosine deaminase